MKRCTHCKKSKSLDCFGENFKSADGRNATCITCREVTKTWTAKNKAHIQAYEGDYRTKKLQDSTDGWENSPGIRQRFYEKIAYCEHGPECIYCCHLWTGTAIRLGYGQFNPTPRRHVWSHRAAWILHHRRPIPDKIWVLHECDYGGCVNATHLFLGTPQDNTNDMRKKNRQDWRGRGTTWEQLIAPDVSMIRILIQQGYSQGHLARIFRVSHAVVWNIVHRKTWKHVRLSSYA